MIPKTLRLSYYARYKRFLDLTAGEQTAAYMADMRLASIALLWFTNIMFAFFDLTFAIRGLPPLRPGRSISLNAVMLITVSTMIGLFAWSRYRPRFVASIYEEFRNTDLTGPDAKRSLTMAWLVPLAILGFLATVMFAIVTIRRH